MDFVKRNKLIFIIGGSVCFVLIALIILARRSVSDVGKTALTPFTTENAGETQQYQETDTREDPINPVVTPVENTVETVVDNDSGDGPDEDTGMLRPVVEPETEEESEEETQEEESVKKLPIAGIVFMDDYGFYPKMPTTKSGQSVLIVNKSSNPIILRERTEGVNPQIDGVVISPNGTYRTKLYGNGFWTMEDENTGKPVMFTITKP